VLVAMRRTLGDWHPDTYDNFLRAGYVQQPAAISTAP